MAVFFFVLHFLFIVRAWEQMEIYASQKGQNNQCVCVFWELTFWNYIYLNCIFDFVGLHSSSIESSLWHFSVTLVWWHENSTLINCWLMIDCDYSISSWQESQFLVIQMNTWFITLNTVEFCKVNQRHLVLPRLPLPPSPHNTRYHENARVQQQQKTNERWCNKPAIRSACKA